MTRILPSSMTNQTGVATPVPSRLKLSMLRYFPVSGGAVGVRWLSGDAVASGCSDDMSLAVIVSSPAECGQARCCGPPPHGGRHQLSADGSVAARVLRLPC